AGLFSFAILIALWTASAGVRSMMVAMNRAYDVPEGRPMWKLYPLSTFYTLGIALMLLSAAALMVVGPTLMGRLAGLVGFEDYLVILWAWLRWPVAILLLIVAVAVVYYVTPDLIQEFRFITTGPLGAAPVRISASLGLRGAVDNIAHYRQ